MVICHFNIKGVTARPDKTDSPLIIHSDTVLPLAIPFQLFELVTWWYTQIVKRLGGVEHQELPQSGTPNGIC
jgi:hypothetical protein